ncbi:MAG: VWA domain-containing protein [Bacteroidales bacterium]|nr:VWA domain-containing protein [Bacteroidales bacterium]
MRKVMTALLLTLALGAACHAQPAANEQTRLLLVLDCSASMWEHWQSASKIKVTQQVLLSFIDSVARQHDVDIALRVFGHLNRNRFGTRLEVPFADDNIYSLQSKIKTLVPNGGCTVEAALTDAVGDFPATGTGRNIILIVTDGMDNRDNELCEVARQVQLSGVVVQTFVVGIAGGAFSDGVCTEAYMPVHNEEQFSRTLHDIFNLAGRTARVVMRVVDAEGELFETELAASFCDSRTGVDKMSTLYSLGPDLLPDTLMLDPLTSYDLTLFTHPPLRLHGLRFNPDECSQFDVTAAQGSLRVVFNGGRQQALSPTPTAIVRRSASCERVAAQQVGETGNYLEGRYDVEVQTLPPVLLRGVEVSGGNLTELSVPSPGQLTLGKPRGITTGTIFRLREGKSEFVADLNPSTAAERLSLQPGEYEVVLRRQGTTAYSAVTTRRFVIESGQITKVQF